MVAVGEDRRAMRSARPGQRAKRIGRAMASSARASGAPTQKWMPAPKARFGAGGRGRGRSGCGSGKRAGSRFGGGEQAADAVAAAEAVAEGLDVLERDAGEEVERRVEAQDLLDGGRGGRGDRRTAGRVEPVVRIAATPLPMAWTVASWPALSSRTQVAISSSVSSRSPSASAAISAVMRSSAGRARRCATWLREEGARSRAAAALARPRLRGRGGPGTSRPWRATRRGAAAPSSSGTPRRRAMTMTGSGSAKAGRRSKPAGSRPSSRPLRERRDLGAEARRCGAR